MKPEKTVHTVDNLDKQIQKISNELGDVSPLAINAAKEKSENIKAKKAAFYAKFKKKKND